MRAHRTLETYSVFQDPRNGGPGVRHAPLEGTFLQA